MMKTEKNTPMAQATPWYTEQFSALERGLNGDAASALHALRKDAFRAIHGAGVPDHAERRVALHEHLARSQS